ncbi:MAG: iron ABC transporter [Deltaproteobacteria bacterium]|nr:MAG: iron ABC transporter [Deltaproteobacteria bacterium]
MRFPVTIIAASVVIFLLFLVDLGTGSVAIPVSGVFSVLTGKEVEVESWKTIILIFRMPKALTAVIAGAGLAVSGLMMQTLFRNPLAGPSVLGISSGASLGVALIVLGSGLGRQSTGLLRGLGTFGNFSLVTAATLGALLVLIIILLAARRVPNIMTLLIIGLLCGFAFNAVVSVLIHFSRPEMIQAYVVWSFGSFGNVTREELVVFLPIVLVTTFFACTYGKGLNVLLLGETYARSMGMNFVAVRYGVIVVTAILAGSVTAYCGPVGFIGIAVPHLARILLGSSDHRVLLPGTALLGTGVALCADIMAQLPGVSTVLPLNSVTALIGSPVIIWFLLQRRKFEI